MQFTDYPLADYLQTALKDMNFYQATDIQAQVIPEILSGHSVVAQSQTGSGKSLAFLLPLLSQLTNQAETQVLITAPSRELADQLYQVTKSLLAYASEDIFVERAYGGTDGQRQAQRLEASTPQIVIGTPGRILDLVNRQLISVHQVSHFVVDEADMTLDMGFLTTVDQIASHMPNDLSMYVFSATIPEKLKPFLRKYLANPKWIRVANEQVISPTIENILLAVRGRDKKDLLYQVTQVGQPYLMLIFANTIETVDSLHQYLLGRGLKIAKIHGDLDARERRRVMKQVHNLDFQYVVASDLAARGIDIPGVSHVVNYEIPGELEFFIHRVGRTGRQGLPGQAITMYEPDHQKDIAWLEGKGIHFEDYDIKQGEWQPTRSNRQRQDRPANRDEIDHTVKGMIDKNKRKKVKPGYRKKLKKEIGQHQRRKAQEQRRQKMRQQRRDNKARNQVDY
ncbi:DEAD/DEAH box helicase [Aerococcus urinaehominis]|uniref:DEAD/DEAH box helicase n=1 Tax=Aerococcus urinaehominis TaxID=128944 RepID=A0A0X8FKE2_9LACT|nr:DEAD/DEAH box helicase [Aerococcus urinaehominis]AMB98927.1 DEAD/DEAH box helicase [Aerococcus urinaehominis]SDM39940.1 ATP-dependent RNA helicase CshB [Aerococcus urinaehominis]